MFDLKEKACIVTGASKGIGLGLVQALLRHGAYCLMLDVDYKVFSLKRLLPKYLIYFTIIIHYYRKVKIKQGYYKKNLGPTRYIS